MKKNRLLFLLAAIFILPIGYAVMHGMTYYSKLSQDNIGIYLIYTVAIILLGLGLPYFMLKFASKAAKARDSRESVLNLEDLPKDKKHYEKTH